MIDWPRWGLGLAGAALLAGATPPAWFAGAEFLALLGLAWFYAVATESRRPLLVGYVFGLVHLGVVAWSLRFVAGWATVAIVALGAVYYLLVVVWTKIAPGARTRAVWFGIGVAVTAWLRSRMPEIHYPHGQPAHALFGWPMLLGPVRWGGEVLANAVFAWTAAAAVDVYRAWRTGQPGWGGARTRLLLALGGWAGSCLIGPPHAEASAEVLRVAAIEPGPELVGAARGQHGRLIRDRLIAPTVELAGPGAVAPPDLVLWPESCVPWFWVEDRRSGMSLAPGASMLGAVIRRDGAEYSAAVLFDSRGALRGWHEKKVPVPAAERLPGLDFLPDAIVEWGSGIVGYLPRLAPGVWVDPLELPGGVRVGGMVCYDNAFAWVAREHVARGAQVLAVVSNEAWYRGGAELDQMVAMSVFRVLETATPIVRSTVDGRTVWVGVDGRVHALPSSPGAGQVDWPRVLRAEVEIGPGSLGPLAWVQRVLPWLGLATGLSALLAIRRKSCRLKSIDSVS